MINDTLQNVTRGVHDVGLAAWLGGSMFEWRGLTLFLRLAGAEVYVCTAEVSDWWTLREEGSFEAAAGRLRLSASRATATHEP